MELKKLHIEDMFDALDYVSRQTSTWDNMENHMKSTMHILLYHQLNQYSREEMEAVKAKSPRGGNLFGAIWKTKSPFLFSLLLEKKAFHDCITPSTRWVIESIPPSPRMYQCAYLVQSCETSSQDKNFGSILSHILYAVKDLGHGEQEMIAEKLFVNYPQHKKEILETIAGNITGNENFSHALIAIFAKNAIDINSYGLLDKKIVNPWPEKKDSPLFISSQIIPSLHKLLQAGFRFDENYQRQGYNLMTTVLKSQRIDIVTTILPFIDIKEPMGITMEEQHELLDFYKNKKEYEKIKALYFAKYYEYSLASEKSSSPKIKI